MTVMRIVIGVVVALAGAVWFVQGIGVLPGSFMSGSALWAVIGAACVVIGVLLAASDRLRRGA